MSIISLGFFILTAVSALVYWIVPKKARWVVLLAASWVFIWFSNKSIPACAVMLCMLLIAYLAGLVFSKIAENGVIRRTVMLVSVVIEAGLLVLLKDLGFFIHIFDGAGETPGFISYLAPVGISYFALSLISYILDTYWQVQESEKNPLKVMLFGSYFPLLTSGPIVRYHETGAQLFEEKTFDYRNFCFGLQRMLWGFFKKLVIADRVAALVNTVYADPAAYPGFYVWTAIAAFVLQLYCDFSGCLDILFGISQLFGVKLPENFDLPFISRNLSEFWRRWHITLGLWLKDYILYPVLKSSLFQSFGKLCRSKFGKKYGKKIPTICGLLISWFLIGFWHGGGWNYIVGVGLWMWFVISLGEFLEPLLKWLTKTLRIKTDTFSWHLFQSVRTFLIYMAGIALFRAESLRSGLELFGAGLGTFNPRIFADGSLLELGLSGKDITVVLLSLLVIIAAVAIRITAKVPVREWMARQNIVFRWLIWFALIIAVIVFGQYGPGYNAADFIYGGF